MSTTSTSCAIVTCTQIPYVFCYCCSKNLCLDHLSNHTALVNSQSKSSIDQIKRINIDKLIANDRLKLEKWRDDSLKKIHRYYEKKCDELDEFYAQKSLHQQQELTDTKFQTTILNIQQNGIPIHIRSLPIDNNLITFGELKTQEFDIINLSSPIKTYNISKSSGIGMATNNQSLLIDQNPDVILFNQDSIVTEQFTWKYGSIRDMCWSFGLNSFIIITEMNKTYLINENTLSIDCIEPMMNQLWMSCTCSNSLLYLLSLSNAVVEFNLLPTLSYDRRWDQPDTCRKHETIKDISCNEDTLALVIISYSTKMAHLILRSLTTFDLLFSVRLDMIVHSSYQLPIRCCPFKNHQWLVSEANTSRLFYIGKNGKLQGTLKYDQQPYNTLLFGSRILVIRTETTINFHEL
ncbi:unnamed protein product [Adineta steineri]|uniref:Uncharacterized protein n=2 Tax=Adineta steineri TaxID=433720 RepID=A0A813QE29_9BILA|nr:unnamed protein product [Adineta steineri]CAF3686421.1 unnamed protein product [Adineta steineri]